MQTTLNIGLPLLASGQAQKHVTLNDALLLLDAVAQLSVVSSATTAPPPAPPEGSCYIVPPSASGVWAGQTGRIALFDAGGWTFITPRDGWQAWVQDIAALRFRTGGDWLPLSSDAAAFKTIGVNATASTDNRLTVSSPGTLLNHSGQDHRLGINKAGAAATASVLFQSGFTATAEIGSVGSNNLHVRTLSGTEGWRDRLFVNAETGYVGIGTTSPVLGPVQGSVLHLHAAGGVNDWSATRYTVGSSAGASDGLLVGNLGGTAYFWHYQAGSILFGTASATRMAITGTGQVGIGTAAPTSRLHVDGPVRVGSSTVSALPNAATTGAGAILFVSNETGGPTLAFSDGTAWRRVQDRVVVT
jgi:hypothetical protein